MTNLSVAYDEKSLIKNNCVCYTSINQFKVQVDTNGFIYTFLHPHTQNTTAGDSSLITRAIVL